MDTKASRILIAADGSPAAGRAAKFLAANVSLGGTKACVLTVLSYGMTGATVSGQPLFDVGERDEDVQRAVQEATFDIVELLAKQGADPSVTHRFGNPPDEILEEIDHWGPELVVMGKRGLNTVTRWLLGSVSERVVRHSKVPVLVVP